MINWFRRHDKSQEAAHALYLAAVAQARQPRFYASHGVPDSLDGRFDLIVLHVYLLLRPLNAMAQANSGKGSENQAGEVAQALFDIMFGDMDRSLREIGVSDISVGKRVKQMAKAFYGRVSAYDEGLTTEDQTLAEALERNLFGTVTPEASHIQAMTAYLRRQAEHMDSVPIEQLLSGTVQFAADPE